MIEGDALQFLRFQDGNAAPVEDAAVHAVSVAQGGTGSVRDEAGTRGTRRDRPDPGAVWGDSHRAQIEDFLAAIRTDGTPHIDGYAGRKPLEIILGVYRSSRTGSAITLA